MGFKKGLIFTLFLLLGILLGSVLTEVAQSVSFLRFFTINVNVAVVLCIIGSLFVYHKVGKNI